MKLNNGVSWEILQATINFHWDFFVTIIFPGDFGGY